MLHQRSIITVARSVVKKCTKHTAGSLSTLQDFSDGKKTISTGTYCRQRQAKGKGDIFSVDHEQRIRRKYVEESDFAHPKGLRFSSSPFEKASLTFENKDNDDIVNSVATQLPVPDFDIPQPDAADYIEKITSVKFHGLETDFPCLSKRKGAGPEPQYHKIVSGYKVYHHREKFLLKHRNGVLPELDIAYETWGELNENRDNVIMLYTGLSASSHAKSHEANESPGWWEKFIGPGCALDTNKFFIVCSNNLGGCYGSTGPSSINPLTAEPYGTTFPIVTVEDQIRAIFLLLDHLGIDKLYASVGSSLGGMQSLAASVLSPERVNRVVSISGTAQTHPSTIALRYLQRKAIMMDPNWNRGYYYNTGKFPIIGMKLAREIATITYRSGPEWDHRFGRSRVDDTKEPDLCPYFTIENYIDHQGEQFANKYDPNSLIYISKAMDLFDLSELFGSMHSALARVKVPVMIIGVKTDALIPIWQQREMAQQLQEAGNHQVTFYELNSIYGHDTFLLDLNGVGSGVKGFLETDLVERGRVRKPQKTKEAQN